MVTERGHSSASGVLEELEIVQGATTAGEAGQDGFPATLLFVAVGKVHKGVIKGGFGLWELLQANDDAVGGRRFPRAFGDQGSASLLKLLVLENTGIVWVLGAALDEDWVAGIEQLLRGGGCEGGAVFEEFGLSAGVKGGESHCGVIGAGKKVN